MLGLLVGIGSLFGLLLAASSSGNAAVRDIQNNIDPLFKTLAIKKRTYLGGRFIALLAIHSIILLGGIIVLAIASQIPIIAHYFASNNLLGYLQAYFIFGLPNIFIFTGIIFSVCVIFRKGAIAFLVAVLLFFIAQFTMEIIAGEFGDWDTGKRYDLTGMTILRELSMKNASGEMKNDLIPMTSELILNRFSWMGLSALLLFVAYSRFNFKYISGRKKSKKQKFINTTERTKFWHTVVSAPVVVRKFDKKTTQAQFFELIKSSYMAMLRNMAWLILVLMVIVLGIWSSEIFEGQLGVPMIASSFKVIELFSLPPVKIILAVVLTFYSGEVIWKDRDAGISNILNATPIKNWVLAFSKFGSLFLLMVSIQLFFLISAIGIQLLNENTNIDLILMFQVFFGFQFIDLLLFIVLAFAIHVLINHKFLGHILVITAFILMNFPYLFGLYHKLLIFGAAPEWTYTQMSGFAPNLTSWLWFKFYWLLWGIVLLGIAKLSWVRVDVESFKSRVYSSLKAFKPSLLSIILATLLCTVGGFIFYNTNVLNNYRTEDEKLALKAAYEKKYAAFRNTNQPDLRRIFIEAEIFPETEEMEITGKYLLFNNSSEAIDSLHISVTGDNDELTFLSNDRLSELVNDRDLGYRIYRFQPALKPDDSIEIEFVQQFRNNGFSNTGKNSAIVKNGTYFGFQNLPWIGYHPSKELTDSIDRANFNLNPQPVLNSVFDEKARLHFKNKIDFEAILGTSNGQTAITAGELQREWKDKGRNYFHYKTEAPITHNFEILSAEYKILKGKSKDVEIEIYHHPSHTANLDRYMEGIKEALRYFSKHYGQYPHDVIRMVEFPSNGIMLNGNPVTMSYSEGFSNFWPEADPRKFDFPFAIMGHEVAHQWWGDQLSPAPVEGGGLLTESLAWFSSWMLIEEFYGKEHLENLLEIMRQEYLTPRPLAGVPLIRSVDHFSVFRRGPFALYTLKEFLGREKMMAALNNLIIKFGPEKAALPTSLDLYAELQTVTPDSLQGLVQDLFYENVFWEFDINDVKIDEKAKNWMVSLDIESHKFSADEKGKIKKLPLNEYVEIALYANSSEYEFGEQIYLKRYHLDAENQKIEIVVPVKPDGVAIDPRRLFSDRDLKLNSFLLGK
ncbi:hypothetical protein [Christiangramia sp. SM2212]|uniref:Peptidase M1 membrane alanine aminopeptidase domain-containing protein n=1 Tax=Christiangramia sediminicola TaxID=3073267 RepID=A0ABU1EMI7_9FLAO|nr:hypothetical protein [Christiangramia sp. SM2212]MDR5589606.1 hypothetical protein [Christiangramia sp. SM2212]